MALIGAARYSDEFDISNELVTLLSLIFTSLSISLSVAEYFLSKKLLACEKYLIITFEALSPDFTEMSRSQFRSAIIYQKYKFINNYARKLKVESEYIDRVKPIQTDNGAIFQLIIDNRNNIQTEAITQEMLAQVWRIVIVISKYI